MKKLLFCLILQIPLAAIVVRNETHKHFYIMYDNGTYHPFPPQQMMNVDTQQQHRIRIANDILPPDVSPSGRKQFSIQNDSTTNLYLKFSRQRTDDIAYKLQRLWRKEHVSYDKEGSALNYNSIALVLPEDAFPHNPLVRLGYRPTQETSYGITKKEMS